MKEDIYFCLDLTENEHEIVKEMILEACASSGMDLVYYRKVKTGHIPCIREVKVRFNGNSPTFFRFMGNEGLWEYAKRWKDGKLVNYVDPAESCLF